MHAISDGRWDKELLIDLRLTIKKKLEWIKSICYGTANYGKPVKHQGWKIPGREMDLYKCVE